MKSEPSKQDDTSAAEEWVEYRNDNARIKFKYPKSRVHTPGEVQFFDDGSIGEVAGTLTAPSGRILEWHYTVGGGKGGDCEPNPSDTPFADGNKCSSKQIFSADVLPALSTQDNLLLRTKRLIVTKTKHRSGTSEAPIIYQVCLDDFYPSNGTPQPGTRMSLVFPCEYWATGFNMKFEVADEAALESAEAKTAGQIMRTVDTF